MRPVPVWYPYAGLLALTVLAYLPIWENGYVDFDDDVYLTRNPHVLEGFTPRSFFWAWTTIDPAPYWLPLTWLSFQLDAQCFAQRTPDGEVFLPPAAVHGQNLFWHTASVLLLFSFWQRVTGRRGLSLVVAALFAVHPMHVESVAWATERKDVLCVFFGLLALWAYVGYVRKPGRLRYLALMAAYLLSLLSKPMLMTLPFVLLLLDYWPLGRMRGTTAATGELPAPMSLRQLIREKLPLFLMAAVIAMITLQARSSRGSIVSLLSLSFTARLANALTAYGWYVSSSLCPLDLAVLYPHPWENWSLPAALTGGALVLSLSLLCVWQARRRPWLLVGWLWFVCTLFPVIGFAQGGKQAWADRFSYWPHIGLFVALVWGLAELLQRWRLPVLLPRLAGAMVLGWLVLRTGSQLATWRNADTLWEQALRVTTDNDQAHERLARLERIHGHSEQAELHLHQAVRIQRRRFGIPTRPLRPPLSTVAAP
jgi:hypothetical protein